MKLLMFEDSPEMILALQKMMTNEDRWYATCDAVHARALVMQGDADVIVVRRCHLRQLMHGLGCGPGEGMPGGRPIVVLPMIGSTRFLQRYLRSGKIINDIEKSDCSLSLS